MARIFTDPATGKTYMGDPVSGEVMEVGATGQKRGRRAQAQQFVQEQLGRAQAGLSPMAEALQQKAEQTGEYIRTKPMRAGLRGGLAGGALMAIPSLMEGRPAEAFGGLAGSAAGGAAGAALGSALLPGVGTVIGGLAGSALGGMLGGGAAEAAVSAYTGKPSTGKTGTEVAQPPRYIDTPFGRVNLNDAASMEDTLNRNQKRQLEYYGTLMGMSTSNLKDLTQLSNEQEINMQKAMLPITTKLANDQLTRAQALINTQNNAYVQQMMIGAQANLALGAQRERGATMRQALATNPYVVALASPSISIG
jgi:hypothetical protein